MMIGPAVDSGVADELDLPRDWQRFQLPPALHDCIQDLLDQQHRDEKLSPKERREAEALAELADMLSLMKLRAKGAAGRNGA